MAEDAEKKQTIREKVLYLLSRNKGTHYSGSAIAEELQVSRTAVWKAVSQLRLEGYRIEGTTNKGYVLSKDTDVLDTASVYSALSPASKAFYSLECVALTPTTNLDVRDRGIQGAPEGFVLAAEEQTAGRGRQGRHFYSPKNTGVYFSILLRPDMPASDAVLITAAAAAAGARAVEHISGKKVQIKWVNDLFMDGKKISGSLTEGMLSMETGRLDQAVMGIGFNLYDPEGGWPEDIRQVAGSIFPGEIPHIAGMRSALVAAYLNEFLPLYKNLQDRTFLEDYRSRQMLIGREVEVISGDPPYRTAIPADVDRDCRLLIQYTDDKEKALHPLNSGEVRVKAIQKN